MRGERLALPSSSPFALPSPSGSESTILRPASITPNARYLEGRGLAGAATTRASVNADIDKRAACARTCS